MYQKDEEAETAIILGAEDAAEVHIINNTVNVLPVVIQSLQ